MYIQMTKFIDGLRFHHRVGSMMRGFLLLFLCFCMSILPIEARRWSSIQEERWREITSLVYPYTQIEVHRNRLASLEDLIHLESKNLPPLVQPLWIRCNTSSATTINNPSGLCLARKIDGLWQQQPSVTPDMTAHVYTSDDVHLLTESLLYGQPSYGPSSAHTKLSTREEGGGGGAEGEAYNDDLSLTYYNLANLDIPPIMIWIGEGIILVICGMAVFMALHIVWNRLVCPAEYHLVADNSLMRSSEACVYVTSIMLGVFVLTLLLLPPTLSYAKACAALLMCLNLACKFSKICYAFFNSFHLSPRTIPCLYPLQIIVLLTCLCVIPIFLTWLGFDSMGANRWSYLTGWYQAAESNDMSRFNFAFLSPRLCDLLGLVFYVVFYARLCKQSKCFELIGGDGNERDDSMTDSEFPIFLSCNLMVTCFAFLNPCLILFASWDTYFGTVFHVICETSGIILFGLVRCIISYNAKSDRGVGYKIVRSRPLPTYVFVRPSPSSSSFYHTFKKSDHHDHHPHYQFHNLARRRMLHTD
jgi:hypothetical protein